MLTRKSATLAIVLTGAFSAPAMPQSRVVLNSEIPQMLVRLCPTLSEAQTEAALAYQMGQGPSPNPSQLFQRNENCHLDYATVTPLRIESTIQPFIAWTINYDENSEQSVRAPSLGANARINVSARREQVRYYYAMFVSSLGERLFGWVEIPDNPYIIDYLTVQRMKPSVK